MSQNQNSKKSNQEKWALVKGYLKTKYKVSKEDDETLAFGFSFDDKGTRRSQYVLVTYTESNGDIAWVQILSRCGEIVQKRVDAALTFVGNHICGGMIKMGDNYYIRDSLPLVDLSPALLEIAFQIVVSLADDVEKNFVGGDEN